MGKLDNFMGGLTVDETEEVMRLAAQNLPDDRLFAVVDTILSDEQKEYLVDCWMEDEPTYLEGDDDDEDDEEIHVDDDDDEEDPEES